MADEMKPEIHLEVSSGFFRIPTETANFNITVLGAKESSATKIIEKIVEVEKTAQSEDAPSSSATSNNEQSADESSFSEDALFFQKAFQRYHADVSALGDIAGGAGSDSDHLSRRFGEIVEMAQDAKTVLSGLKEATGGSKTTASPDTKNLTKEVGEVAEALGKALEIVESLPVAETPAASPAPPAPQVEKKTRFLFNIDTVFQTIYELCTNETVKEHITKARGKAGELFKKDVFYDAISPMAGEYAEDDGFLSVPMSDVYQSLSKACNDKTTINLLKNMDSKQSEIFLDQFLPLEVPEKEEIEVEAPGQPEAAEQPETTGSESGEGGQVAQLGEYLKSSLDALDKVSYQLSDLAQSSTPDSAGEEDLAGKVEDALNIVASIHYDAAALFSGGAEGENGDGQARLGGIVRCFEQIIKRRESEPNLDFDEAYEAECAGILEREKDETSAEPDPDMATEEDISEHHVEQAGESSEDDVVESDATEADVALSDEKSPDGEDEDFGEASQEDIDRLLEEMG